MSLPEWWFRWWHKGESLRHLQHDDDQWISIHLNTWDTLHGLVDWDDVRADNGLTCPSLGDCMFLTGQGRWARVHAQLRAVLWHIDQLKGVDLDRVAHFEGRKADSMRRAVFRLRQGLVMPENQLQSMIEAAS